MAPRSRETNGNVGKWIRWLVSAFLVVLFSGTTAGFTSWKLTKSYVDAQLAAHNNNENSHEVFRESVGQGTDDLADDLKECQNAIANLTTLIAVLQTELTNLNRRLERLHDG